jgi:hypothetical protein
MGSLARRVGHVNADSVLRSRATNVPKRKSASTEIKSNLKSNTHANHHESYSSTSSLRSGSWRVRVRRRDSGATWEGIASLQRQRSASRCGRSLTASSRPTVLCTVSTSSRPIPAPPSVAEGTVIRPTRHADRRIPFSPSSCSLTVYGPTDQPAMMCKFIPMSDYVGWTRGHSVPDSGAQQLNERDLGTSVFPVRVPRARRRPTFCVCFSSDALTCSWYRSTERMCPRDSHASLATTGTRSRLARDAAIRAPRRRQLHLPPPRAAPAHAHSRALRHRAQARPRHVRDGDQGHVTHDGRMVCCRDHTRAEAPRGQRQQCRHLQPQRESTAESQKRYQHVGDPASPERLSST